MDTTATLDSPEAVVGVAPSGPGGDVRRYSLAVAIGGIAVAVPYLWILTDLWNRSPDLLRTVVPNHRLSNFYDLQARAMFHGHLWVPIRSLGDEAFVHGGRQFTYFGVFPSLLRMPVLLFTHSLDGRLTGPSILLSWVVTGLFSALLLWRVRVLVRGPVALGWAEASTYGLFMATVLGGSVLVDLAASPWVYSEDITWGVALTTGSLFALLGVLEAPSRRRVAAAGVLILAAILTRGSIGYGCVLGALLVAAWFGSGKAGAESRRWWLPVLLAGLIPLLIASVVSWAKFGVVYGYPLHDQIYFKRYLKDIKGSYFSARYVPSTVATYLGFHGLAFSRAFPFITLPMQNASAVGNVPLFGTQQVSSIPESMPLLFLLTIWGVVTAFRRRVVLRTRTTVIPLIAAAVPAGAILIFGFLDNRFLGDFVPLLIMGSAVGIVDLWRRIEGSGRSAVRNVFVVIVAALALFGIVANMAVSITPTGWWSGQQDVNFVKFQKSVGDATGTPLSGYVARGKKLPKKAPIGQLFITGNCTGLYLFVPNGLRGWVALEKAPSHHALALTVHGPTTGLARGVPLFTVGPAPSAAVSVDPDGAGRIRFAMTSAGSVTRSAPVAVEPNVAYRLTISGKGSTHTLAAVSHRRVIRLKNPLLARGRIALATQDGRSEPGSGVTLLRTGQRASAGPLCRSLIPKS